MDKRIHYLIWWIINQILMKFIYMVTIYMKQNINFWLNKRLDVCLKHCNDSKAFIQYSNNMVDIYKNIEVYNPNKKRDMLIAFDDMIALNISLVFITQTYFAVPKYIRLNCTHYFIMKIPNKRELTQIASQIDLQDFIDIYEKCTAKTYYFLSYWYYSCIK